jgi:hypothetical protein
MHFDHKPAQIKNQKIVLLIFIKKISEFVISITKVLLKILHYYKKKKEGNSISLIIF